MRVFFSRTSVALPRSSLVNYQPDATDEGSVSRSICSASLAKIKAKRYAESEAFCGTFHIDEGYEEMNSATASIARSAA